FQRRDRGLQIAHGGQAMQAIGEALVGTTRRRIEVRHRGEHDRRSTKHRGVDCALVRVRIAAEVNDLRCGRVVARVAHRPAGVAAIALAIPATCAGTGKSTSITIASSGSSRVANWLSRSDDGMYSCWRWARRAAMVLRSPLRYTKRTSLSRARRLR